MREQIADLWNVPADSLVVTTNGYVRRDGAAVMGRGCALQAAAKWPVLPELLGARIMRHGNIVHVFSYGDVSRSTQVSNLQYVFMLPVKHNWNEMADINLIVESVKELVNLVNALDLKNVVMPRPGCGNGGLDWEDVKPSIEGLLDDRFMVVSW